VDECTHYMRQINLLVDHLSQLDESALTLVITANSAQWAPRVKSPNFFRFGTVVELSRLEQPEIQSLLNLVEFNKDIANLVDADFKRQRREQQLEALRRKCSADMFVCLSNIFGNESIDVILLREYDDLNPALQDYYRYVAALEAVGTRVHRQLIIRMLNMAPTAVTAVLTGLEGIVEEYDVSPKQGIFGWSTRHLVIARKITDYKFSNLDELTSLFDNIIANLNPAEPIEIQTVRDICDSQFGIGRLGDAVTRQRLYRALIAIAPGERIPWHRLIRELLSTGVLDDTEYVIRNAEEAVGRDAPIDRYKVRVLMLRAAQTEGISDKDRIALLRRAYEQGMSNIQYHKWDKFSYIVLCEVAVALASRGESRYVLTEAIGEMQKAADRILDPDMSRRLRQFEEQHRRLLH
jgi:hypothetical protein